MKRLLVPLVALAVSLYVSSRAPAQSPDYFPLSIGNSWTYAVVIDTTHKFQCSIFDTARVGPTLYYLHSGPALAFIGVMPLPVDSLRSDTLFRIWRYEKGQEYMLFDFYHGNYPSYTTYPEIDIARVTTNVEITVPAGHFTNCVDIYFPRSFNDESIGYVFAPGVGIVRWYGPFYAPTSLVHAVVNGKLISSVDMTSAGVPSEFTLEQNYPNPFNPSTTVKYELPRTSHVNLSVFDILGREVSVLVNDKRDSGVYEVNFDASNLASGVYFYRLQAGDYVATKRLLLLK